MLGEISKAVLRSFKKLCSFQYSIAIIFASLKNDCLPTSDQSQPSVGIIGTDIVQLEVSEYRQWESCKKILYLLFSHTQQVSVAFLSMIHTLNNYVET